MPINIAERIHSIFGDNLIKKVMKNTGIVLFGNSTVSVLNLISFALMAKQLGPEYLAILVLAQTYALVVNDLFNIQTWESMLKFGFGKSDDMNINRVVKTNIALDFFSAMVAFIFAIIMLKPAMHIFKWDGAYYNVFLLYCFTIPFILTTFTIGVPRLFNKFGVIAKVFVAGAFLKLAGVIYAMYFSNELTSYIVVYFSADIFINLSLSIYSLKLLKDYCGSGWWRDRLNFDKKQMVFIWWTNLRTIVRIPVRHFDMIVISSILSMEMVGFYKVYKEIAGLINRVGEPVNQAIFPEFTRLLGNKEVGQTASVTKKAIFLLLVIGALITFSMLALSEVIMGAFFGSEYLTHIVVFKMLIILFGINFIIMPVNSLFIAAGFAKYSFFIVLFTNIVYIASIYSLGMSIGITGVVLAFAIQMLLNQGLKIYLLRKHKNEWGSIEK